MCNNDSLFQFIAIVHKNVMVAHCLVVQRCFLVGIISAVHLGIGGGETGLLRSSVNVKN